MIDLLRRRGMIPAIVLACAVVTVITWAGLAAVGQPPSRATPSRATPSGGPTIHARLLPMIVPGAPAALLPQRAGAKRHTR